MQLLRPNIWNIALKWSRGNLFQLLRSILKILIQEKLNLVEGGMGAQSSKKWTFMISAVKLSVKAHNVSLGPRLFAAAVGR